GSLIIFVTTLCASSIGIYGEITGEHFWNSRRLSLFILLVVVVICSFVGAIISFPDAKKALQVSDTAVIRLSLFLFVVAMVTCLHLYAMRFSIDKIDDFRKEQIKQVAELTDEAKKLNQTDDGARL